MSTTTDNCIEVCNSLLRGELSAIETYDQAIEKFRGEAAASTLQQLRGEHVTSVNRLRENVRGMGGVPAEDSGAWGTFAKMVEGAAKLFGDTSAIKGLQQGEEHGRSDYEDALKDDGVLPECKDMIRSELLPRQIRNISSLEKLSAMA